MARKKHTPREQQFHTVESGTHVARRVTEEIPDTSRATLPQIRAVQYRDAHSSIARHDTPILPVMPVSAGHLRATLTVMSGREAGRVIALEGTTMVLGRDPESDIWIEDSGVSRKHARIGRGPDGGFYVQDLDSTNGSFVGMLRVRVAELSSGDYVQLGPGFMMRFALTDDAEESLQRQLYESSVRDPLTGAFNRKYLADRLVSEVSHARRTGGALALLMIDLDHFKDVNDRYGHLRGDEVLRTSATRLGRLVRADDVLARFGGDEFVVLARDNDSIAARALADRLRRSIEELTFELPTETVSVTASIGVASLAELEPFDEPFALVALADQRLYGAKLKGRNVVCSES
jgi:diguanylate cyclase (GGDEF)-like protein